MTEMQTVQPGTELATFVPEEYRARFVMEPEEAAALDTQLRKCMRAVLKEGTDYGTIPGMGDKPSLFKPGAEKLLQWFGFGFVNDRDEIERDADGNRIGVTYRCTVGKQLADGRKFTVATCEGYAGYDEDKFYTSAEAANAKAEAKERYWAAKDRREPNPSKWGHAVEYRAPWNSVLKMAQKRALVGAAIDATAAAGLFTQDIEDTADPAQDRVEPPPRWQPEPAPAQPEDFDEAVERKAMLARLQAMFKEFGLGAPDQSDLRRAVVTGLLQGDKAEMAAQLVDPRALTSAVLGVAADRLTAFLAEAETAGTDPNADLLAFARRIAAEVEEAAAK